MNDKCLKIHELPQLPQRQDSTHDQLVDLERVAVRLGMYDAADVLRGMNDEVLRKRAMYHE